MNEIEWESCLLEPRPDPALEARFRRDTGRPGSLMRYWSRSDWVSDTIVRFSVEVATRVVADADLVDQAGLVVSQDNSCRFCFGAQRVLLQALGMSEEHIARLEQAILIGDLSPRDRAALAYARKLSRSQPLSTPSELAKLREVGFAPLEIAELSGSVALHLFFNRVSTFSALPPATFERLSEAWWLKLFRPIVKPYFRRLRMHAEPTPVDPAYRDGPFGEVVGALDGLPMADAWGHGLKGALESQAISPRTPALVFAVVSRALGCAASERESRRLLAQRGVPETEVDDVLTHLSSPGLTPAEQAAVTFARESVWYTPAPIQRRCRALKTQLDDVQLIELIGLVSLANSVCRLGLITGGCD